MNRIISEPTWGATIIEDTETGEFSFQCICGGVGMYAQRIVLNADEVKRLREGTFDSDQMVSDVCKHEPYLKDRLVQALLPSELVGGKPIPKR